MDQSPPTYVGNFTVGQNGNHFFIYQGDRSYLCAMDQWLNSVKFYDMADPINPTYISTIMFVPCSDTEIMGMAWVHPSNKYLYLTPSINDGSCPSLIRTFDISDLTNIVRLNDIHIPEVEEGASLDSITFAPNNLAGLALSSNGASWYDFTDPLNPTPVAHIDVAEVTNTYTLGVFRIRYGLDGIWYLWDWTEDWHNFHAVKLVPMDSQASTSDGDDDCDDNSVMALLFWVFLILFLISSCFACYFYSKWNSLLSFEFGKLEEIITPFQGGYTDKRNPEEGVSENTKSTKAEFPTIELEDGVNSGVN